MADIFTNVGEEWAVDRMVAVGTLYVAWGTGAGTAAKGDTTLFTEASEARTSETPTKTGTGATAKMQNLGIITCAGAGKTITNAGVLTASVAGTLVQKSDFTGIALNVGDSIQFTFTLDPG